MSSIKLGRRACRDTIIICMMLAVTVNMFDNDVIIYLGLHIILQCMFKQVVNLYMKWLVMFDWCFELASTIIYNWLQNEKRQLKQFRENTEDSHVLSIIYW